MTPRRTHDPWTPRVRLPPRWHRRRPLHGGPCWGGPFPELTVGAVGECFSKVSPTAPPLSPSQRLGAQKPSTVAEKLELEMHHFLPPSTTRDCQVEESMVTSMSTTSVIAAANWPPVSPQAVTSSTPDWAR